MNEFPMKERVEDFRAGEVDYVVKPFQKVSDPLWQ
jgi:hypothetical protein